TPYLYKNSEKYMLNHLKAPEEICYPEGRITMDTLIDYNYLKEIFDLQQDITKDTVKLVKWLKQNPHPDMKKC
ncbi:MAG: hypothetical protein FWF38_08155, partial [Spirochaetaceae bacterium]|nr:hypothetical protein [Spirochaetaceae bacterium]